MTTEPAAASPGHRGTSMGLRFVIAFVLGVTLVVGAGGGALYAYGQQYTGKGVTLGYYTHYSMVTGVVLIGTGGPSAPTSLP